MGVIERGKVHSGQIILDHPLHFLEGTEVMVHVEPLEKLSMAPNGKISITTLPFFGIWADREEMADSAEWVSKERERWTKRLARQD
jgi:hypothetical protein